MAFPLQFLLQNLFRYTLMANDKKKHSKKDKASKSLLDAAAVSLKKFRKVTKQLSKLSTGQKLVGGVALLAAGLTYLANKQSTDGPPPTDAPDAAEPPEAGGGHVADEETTVLAHTSATPRKSRKPTKAR